MYFGQKVTKKNNNYTNNIYIYPRQDLEAKYLCIETKDITKTKYI